MEKMNFHFIERLRAEPLGSWMNGWRSRLTNCYILEEYSPSNTIHSYFYPDSCLTLCVNTPSHHRPSIKHPNNAYVLNISKLKISICDCTLPIRCLYASPINDIFPDCVEPAIIHRCFRYRIYNKEAKMDLKSVFYLVFFYFNEFGYRVSFACLSE